MTFSSHRRTPLHSKPVKAMICATATATAAAVFASAASASARGAVSANWGACMTYVSTDYRSTLAPGRSGMGPLTVVNGEIVHYTTAFAGGIGCPR